MTFLLVVLGVVAVLLPGVAPLGPPGARPRTVAALAAAALAVGVTTLLAGVVLAAGSGVVAVAAGSGAGSVSGHLVPGGSWVAWACVAASVVLAGRGVWSAWKLRRLRRRARPEEWLARREPTAGPDVVVLPVSIPLAYSVRGRRPQIVVSQGLCDRCGPDLLQLVLDHERAHLLRRHDRHLAVAAVVDAMLGWIPGVGRSTLGLRLAIERAADEDAAGPDPGRRGRLVQALARFQHRSPGASSPEVLVYRTQRLLAPPETRSAGTVVAAVVLVVVAVAALTTAVHIAGDVPHVVASSQP